MDNDVKKLEDAIQKAKTINRKIGIQNKNEAPKDLSFGKLVWHAGTDLFAGIAVGCFLGYAVDRYAHSYPWALILGFLLGAAGGFLNVLKTLKKNGLFFWGETSERKHK